MPASPRLIPRTTDFFALAVLILIWAEVVSRLRFEWSINPQYGYGWAVPFAAAYLFWRRWESAPPAKRGAGRSLIIVSASIIALVFVPARVVAEANPDWRLLSWIFSFAVVVISLSLLYLAGGVAWLRHFAFPILFFLVAVPWPTQLEQFVIQSLMRLDAALNVEFLNLVGVPALQRGNVIEVGAGLVGIDEACTGVRSLQATFMVSLFFGELYRFSVWRRVVLVLCGALLAFGCNLVRTFILVYVGAEHGIAAIKRWHDPAGYSILIICLVALWLISLFLRRHQRDEVILTSEHSSFPISRLFLVSLCGLLALAEVGTWFWYRAHRSPANLVAWSINWPQNSADFRRVPVAEEAQELLRYNEGGGASWTGADGHAWQMYFFRWLPGRTAGLFIKNHRPDICLPASGIMQRGPAAFRLQTINDIPLPIRNYAFDASGTPLYVFYCYWDGTAPDPSQLNAENWTARGRLEAAWRGKRDVGTQMLELIVAGYSSRAEAEQAASAQLQKLISRS